MATLTSRLKLLKPDRLELVNVLTALNANLDRLDSGGNGAYVCTSTTRPNGTNYPLFDGMLIYETDTGYLRMRVGGQWMNCTGGDTGWQDLTMRAGFTGSASEVPAVRRIGDMVFMKGSIIKSSGSFVNSGYDTVADLPSNKYRPYNYARFSIPPYSTASAHALVAILRSTGNNLDIGQAGATTPNTAFLDGVSYLAA